LAVAGRLEEPSWRAVFNDLPHRRCVNGGTSP